MPSKISKEIYKELGKRLNVAVLSFNAVLIKNTPLSTQKLGERN